MDLVRRLLRGAAIALAFVALSTTSCTCFDPQIQNGAIECATDRDCPPGFHCRFPGDNRCWLTLLDAAQPSEDGSQPTSDGAVSDGAIVDGSRPIDDGSPPDGPIQPNDGGFDCGDPTVCNSGAGEFCPACPECCMPTCGDPGMCEAGETCAMCSECCVCNPNGVCATNETCDSCPQDCCPAGCDMDSICEPGEFCTVDCFDCCVTSCDFDLVCESALGESCLTCPNDCGPCPTMDGGIGPGPADGGGPIGGDGGTGLCGNLTCDVSFGENCSNCLPDCGQCTCEVPPVCDCQYCPQACSPPCPVGP